MGYPITAYKNYSITNEPIVSPNHILSDNLGAAILKPQGFGFVAENGNNEPGTIGAAYNDRLDPALYPENLPFYDCVLPEKPIIGASATDHICYRFGLAIYWNGRTQTAPATFRVSGAYFYIKSNRGLVLGIDNYGNAGLYFWSTVGPTLTPINTFRLSDQFDNGQVNLLIDYEAYFDSGLGYNVFHAVLKIQYNGDITSLSVIWSDNGLLGAFDFKQPLLMPLADFSLFLASFKTTIPQVSATVETWENVNIIPGKPIRPFKLQISDATRFVNGNTPSFKYQLLFFNSRQTLINNWIELDGDIYFPAQILLDNRKNNYSIIVDIVGIVTIVRPGDYVSLQTPKFLGEIGFTCLQWGFAELTMSGLEAKADYKTF